jgi:hypothetical protein
MSLPVGSTEVRINIFNFEYVSCLFPDLPHLVLVIRSSKGWVGRVRLTFVLLIKRKVKASTKQVHEPKASWSQNMLSLL